LSLEVGLVALMSFIGITLMFFGYIIGVEKRMFIFDFYNRSKRKNKEAIAVSVGRYMILIGFYTFITPFLVRIFGRMMALLYPVMLMAILGVMVSSIKKIDT